MPPTLLLLHGWGFDAALWDGLVAALPGWPVLRGDLGYFGARAQLGLPQGPALAVGHSLGAMLLARALPGVPLVAINGFDRFCGPQAVAPRVLARMRSRFADDPQGVLNDFRTRCGAVPAAQECDRAALAEGLAALADENPPPPHAAPVLALHGGQDPILPAALRQAAFPGAARMELAGHGHLLPLSAPQWCAAQIRGFA